MERLQEVLHGQLRLYTLQITPAITLTRCPDSFNSVTELRHRWRTPHQSDPTDVHPCQGDFTVQT
jgi:hypothetical protein